MGLSKNTLDRSDISTYPIKLKYSASYASSSAVNYGITLNRGINGSFVSNDNDFLVYKLAKQLYYNSYLTGSLNDTASAWNDNLQSTAASGTFDNDYRYFPTASGDEITILAIPRTVFGENISRKSLRISGSTYYLIDDGNGNVVDINNNNVHVGNILYAQGIVVITNLDYEYALIQTTTTTTTTSTTSTTTTAAPTTTTTTTTAAPTTTTTSTTTSTTTAAPTTTTTSTTTSTTTACPCVCGVSIQNTDSVSINYTYQDCYDNVYSGTIPVGQTFFVQCPDPLAGTVKNNSVIVIGSATITYGSCQSPAPPPTTTTTSTTTAAPTTTTTSTTTSTTTAAPTTTTTSTTTSTTTAAPTTTTTSTTTSTTTTAAIVCEDWEILNGPFVNIIDYQDCLGNPQQFTLDPSEILGCFSVNSNAFGTDIPFLSTQPFTSNKCVPTTTTTSTTTSTTTAAPTTTTTSTTTSTTTAAPTTTTTSTTTSTTTVEPCTTCGGTVNGSYSGLDSTTQIKCLDLTSAVNGGQITISYDAVDRPNRFNIYEVGGSLIATSGWAGSPSSTPGPWNPPGPGTGTFSFIYDNTKTYELRVDIAADTISDAWSVSITCGPVPTTTTTTSTTTAAPTTTTTSTTTSTTTAAPTTTTTSTTTSTTTTIPVYSYCTGYDATDCCVAESDYSINCGGSPF